MRKKYFSLFTLPVTPEILMDSTLKWSFHVIISSITIHKYLRLVILSITKFPTESILFVLKCCRFEKIIYPIFETSNNRWFIRKKLDNWAKVVSITANKSSTVYNLNNINVLSAYVISKQLITNHFNSRTYIRKVVTLGLNLEEPCFLFFFLVLSMIWQLQFAVYLPNAINHFTIKIQKRHSIQFWYKYLVIHSIKSIW